MSGRIPSRTPSAVPNQAQVQAELSRCVTRLLLDEPFFGHLLAGVIRRVTDDVPTTGVAARGARVELAVNPGYFLRELRRADERVAVVKHEALHLLLHHPTRGRTPGIDRHLWDLATDLVVNQLVGYRLPPSAITLATFPDLGLRRGQTAETYYAQLAALREAMDAAAPDRDGRGAGVPVSAPKSAAALRELEQATWHSDHSRWSAEPAGDLESRAAEGALDGLVERAVARVGSAGVDELPGPLRRLVAATLARRHPRLDWRRVVRLFASSSSRTRIASTLRRPSRRYGTFPGLRVQRLSRLAAAVDTSGSVDEGQLSAFFSELHGLWRRGAEVHVFECDAAVQRRYLYRGTPPKTIAGRGGTRFDPVFEALRANRMERWDGCIYLTDGRAEAPRVRPPCDLLWVLTPTGHGGAHLRFGRVVRLRG